MENIYIGIDVGNNGAIVGLKEDGSLAFKDVMPVIPKVGIDVEILHDILSAVIGVARHIVIEDVHAIYGSSAKATFSFGRGKGIIEALAVTSGIPFTLVKPKEWQKEMWTGIPTIKKAGKNSKDTKKMSLLAAKRLFPSVDLTKSERSTKPHDGIVDALLMAEYARRKFK